MLKMREMQVSFAAGELSPKLHAHVDLQKYTVGLKSCLNWQVLAEGGAENRSGFEFVAEAQDSANLVRVIPFTFNTTQAYALELGDFIMRVIKDGAYVVEADVAISAVGTGNPVVITTGAPHGYLNGEDVYITGVADAPTGPYRVANKTATTFELNDYRGLTIDGATWGAPTSAVANRIYTVGTGWAGADLFELRYTQSADVMTVTNNGYAVYSITRTGHSAWTVAPAGFGATAAAPGGPPVATPTGGGALNFSYVVTAVIEATGEESIQSATAACTNALLGGGVYNTVTFAAVAGASHYNVYKRRGGVFGFVGSADTTSFVDDGIIADTTDTPPTAKTVFNSASTYPMAVEFHQQRKVFGGSTGTPQGTKMSRTGNIANFNVSQPAKDDDAVSFEIANKQVNAILHYVVLNDLIIMTTGGEWKLTGTESDAITPSSINAKRQSSYGSTKVAPLVVGETALFVTGSGSGVRDLQLQAANTNYAGSNLMILAKHLLGGKNNLTIEDWTYQQEPNSTVWAVRSDGTLLGLTYVSEHQIFAWHRHTTDGLFESVCTVKENGKDALYAVVNRTVNGTSRRYIERLKEREINIASDGFFVDSGLCYSGVAVDQIIGLDWLEGKTVSVLADGNPHAPVVVTDGIVTLQAEYTNICLGLPITADLEMLDIDPDGLVGEKQLVSKVIVRVLDTRGLEIGKNSANLTPVKFLPEAYDTEHPLISGDIEQTIDSGFQDHGTLFIRQSQPLPATILAVLPKGYTAGTTR